MFGLKISVTNVNIVKKLMIDWSMNSFCCGYLAINETNTSLQKYRMLMILSVISMGVESKKKKNVGGSSFRFFFTGVD